jgi:hypothetical protein
VLIVPDEATATGEFVICQMVNSLPVVELWDDKDCFVLLCRKVTAPQERLEVFVQLLVIRIIRLYCAAGSFQRRLGESKHLKKRKDRHPSKVGGKTNVPSAGFLRTQSLSWRYDICSPPSPTMGRKTCFCSFMYISVSKRTIFSCVTEAAVSFVPAGGWRTGRTWNRRYWGMLVRMKGENHAAGSAGLVYVPVLFRAMATGSESLALLLSVPSSSVSMESRFGIFVFVCDSLERYHCTGMIAAGAQISLCRFSINLAISTCEFPLALLLDLDGDFVRLHAQLSVKRC